MKTKMSPNENVDGFNREPQMLTQFSHRNQTTVAPLILALHGVSSSCSRQHDGTKIPRMACNKLEIIRNLSFRLLQEELTSCYAKMSGATVKLASMASVDGIYIWRD